MLAKGSFCGRERREVRAVTGIIALNELRRRLRDRSVLITALVAPLAIAAILGFAFANRPPAGPLPIGVSGASPALVRAAARAAQLAPNVTVHTVSTPSRLEREVADGTLAGGVVAYRVHRTLGNLLIPMVSPGATKTPGFKVVDRADALVGQETAQAVAAGLASRLYAARLGNGPASASASLNVEAATVGNGGKAVLDYFAPSIAVVFLFIGSGLGMRSLMLERTGGTLVRIAAAPVRPGAVVTGKLLAVGITGLVSIFVVWGATTAAFGADWGEPLGVLLMCLGAVAAMCGFGVLVTSFARNEREAFAASLIVGLILALLGGNLLPPGALPEFLQVLSLATPNGWALVGFGRLSLLHDPASDVIGPFLVLCLIAAVTIGCAMIRVRRMVAP
jgi:ABC-2 type transport system permease protein